MQDNDIVERQLSPNSHAKCIGACLRMALIVVAVTLGGSGIASAADAVYQPWNAGSSNSGESNSQALIDELRKLIDDADRARAADPRFIADLRSALRRHDYPWRRTLVSDDFRDGNFVSDPTWTVASGEFTVAWGGGLASTVQDTQISAQPSSGNQQEERKPRAEDMAVAILGQLLRNQSRQQSQSAASQPQPQVVAAQPAEIFLSTPITNAFAITATLSSRPIEQSGGVDFTVYQDARRQTGYRLAYTPDSGFTLYRQSSRGTAVVDSGGSTINIIDGQDHVIEWLRTPEGTMTVQLDGEVLLTTVDRNFRDPFAGFALINRGGDYMLRAIRIDGTT